eukprot:1905744-Prymnesium_polylepis.1
MRMLGRAALQKQASNVRAELSQRVVPVIGWKPDGRPATADELDFLPIDDRNTDGEGEQKMVSLLQIMGFEPDEATLLASVAQYYSFA